jgi:Bax protein
MVDPDRRADVPASPRNPTAAPESQALAERFDAHGYDWESILSGDASVPEVSVRTLPKDLVHLRDTDLKKSLFFRSLLPAALQVNREIEAARDRLRDLKSDLDRGARLDPVDDAWLAAIAESYGGDPNDLDGLLLRVDAVPPSLVLAQAAEESGWGTSRFVREGNALFGQYTWNDAHDGIVPSDNAGDGSRRVRAFTNVKAAIAAYVHNLNSHPAYERFRARRASGASGYDLVASLKSYSVRGSDYVETIRVIMRANRLDAVDQAELTGEVQVSRYP